MSISEFSIPASACVEALKRNQVDHVVTVPDWVQLSLHDRLDKGVEGKGSFAGRINSVPLMGGAAGLALGLALARPDKKVIVMDGDASLLMELGGLATVAQQAPKNLLHCVVHNGTQFTGLDNMKTPISDFQFAEVALKCGYVHAERIADGATWAERFPLLLAMDGPVFVELMVEPVPKQTKDGFEPWELPANQYTRMGDEALALQDWLAQSAT